jgi:APA family basic amino acid/polyamine antiporter
MAEKRELRKKLNTLDVTAITAGIVIGAGLFVVTGIGAKYAGSYVWVAYLIAAIPCFMVAFSTSMLAQMYPVESGESYVYPTRIVSHVWGFLSGWGMWLGVIGLVCVTAKAFILYLNALPQTETQISVIGGAVVVLLIFCFINYVGIRTVSIVQNILFIFMVAGIAIFILWGLPHIKSDLVFMGAPMGFNGIMKGASILIFAYTGLTLAADLGEEAKDPKKTIPRGMFFGVSVPTVLYTLLALVSVGVMAWDDFAAADAPVASAATQFMGPAGVTFIIVVAFAAILSSHNGEQSIATRIFFGLSRDKIITGGFASINKFGIPHYALFLSGAVALFLIVSGTIQLVGEILNSMFLFNWIITHLCIFMLPKKWPKMYEEAEFKLSGWKMIVPIIGLVSSAVLLVYQGWVALTYSAIWLAIGAVVYYIGLGQRKEEIKALLSEWPFGRYI